MRQAGSLATHICRPVFDLRRELGSLDVENGQLVQIADEHESEASERRPKLRIETRSKLISIRSYSIAL